MEDIIYVWVKRHSPEVKIVRRLGQQLRKEQSGHGNVWSLCEPHWCVRSTDYMKVGILQTEINHLISVSQDEDPL